MQLLTFIKTKCIQNKGIIYFFSDCRAPQPPVNGSVSLNTVWRIATRMCNPGYDQSGSPALYCNKNGIWMGGPFTCSLKGIS